MDRAAHGRFTFTCMVGKHGKVTYRGRATGTSFLRCENGWGEPQYCRQRCGFSGAATIFLWGYAGYPRSHGEMRWFLFVLAIIDGGQRRGGFQMMSYVKDTLGKVR